MPILSLGHNLISICFFRFSFPFLSFCTSTGVLSFLCLLSIFRSLTVPSIYFDACSKVKAGRLDVHPTDNAIVVFYEIEALLLGEDGETVMGERKQCQKLYVRCRKIKTLTKLSRRGQ